MSRFGMFMEVMVGLLIGLIFGGGCIWFIKRSQIQSIKSQKQASDEQISLLHSQREPLSQENNEKKLRVRELEEIVSAKEKEIRNSLVKTSDANAKIEKITDLEERLRNEINNNQRLTEENTTQKEKISKLTADLDNKGQHHNQIVNKLERDLDWANSENINYKKEIEQAHSISAEANSLKEYIAELKEDSKKVQVLNEQLQSEKILLEKKYLAYSRIQAIPDSG